jgi:hypothetical protein
MHRVPPRYALIGALCVLFALGSLAADTVLMKDGRSYSGTITSQGQTSITIRTEAGVPITLEKAMVRRVTYGDSIQEQKRRQELEAQRQAANERARLAALEAEKKRQADAALEAERKRQADAALEAERKRQADAALEAEKKRQADAALEAERKRQADAALEAERKRQTDAALEAEKKRQAEGPSRFSDDASRLARSALIPGWGQWTAKRPVAGSLYLAGIVMLAGKSYLEASRFRTASTRDQTNGAFLTAFGGASVQLPLTLAGIDLTNRSYAAQKAAGQSTVLFGGAAAGLYLWNLFDAYFFGPSQQSASQIRTTLRIDVSPVNSVETRQRRSDFSLGLQIPF